jgi:SAM-dependent methyltransferase
MRLNVCCGRHILEDWTNVDVVQSTHPSAGGRLPQILADARTIPLPDACADEVMCIHGFEHFYVWETVDVLREWHRLLKPGGVLTLELPDIKKCAINLIEGYKWHSKHPGQYTLWGIFGDPTTRDPYMMHKWGWWPDTLIPWLAEHGFEGAREKTPQWHAAGRERRDMRITSRKPT